MTAPHARQPQMLPRPACTPAAIRTVLAAKLAMRCYVSMTRTPTQHSCRLVSKAT
jgi:hypothetical protein